MDVAELDLLAKTNDEEKLVVQNYGIPKTNILINPTFVAIVYMPI